MRELHYQNHPVRLRCGARKTNETTPKSELLSFTYNTANDLLTLTDRRSKVTTWAYDVEGLVRTKKYHGQSFVNLEYSYDANGWLAWRKCGGQR